MNRRPAYAALSRADETRLTLGLKSETTALGLSVTITANLVATNAGPLRELVADALDDGMRSVVLDFTYCPYADSKGLKTLAAIAHMVHRVSGTIRITNANEDLAKLLALTEIAGLFDAREAVVLYPTNTEAT